MVTLNKKDSLRLLKRMHKVETTPLTLKEKRLIKELQENRDFWSSLEPVNKHNKMPLKGEHLIMTLKVKNDLEDTKFLKKMLFEAIHKSKATIINYVEHKFQPQGYSIVILIGESHASIHTYPENKGLFIDYFTCGDIKTNIFKQYILSKLKVEQVIELATIERGQND
jgi:S-adenosylmethionine decarboxylase